MMADQSAANSTTPHRTTRRQRRQRKNRRTPLVRKQDIGFGDSYLAAQIWRAINQQQAVVSMLPNPTQSALTEYVQFMKQGSPPSEVLVEWFRSTFNIQNVLCDGREANDKTSAVNLHPHLAFVAAFWGNLMHTVTPSTLNPPGRRRWSRSVEVMGPIYADEVRATDSGRFASAGLDGVTWPQWEELRPSVRALFFNSVLLARGFPREMLGYRGIFQLNPGGEELETTQGVPFFVPPVAVRQMHKILARRFQKLLGAYERRHENLMVLAALLHDRRAGATRRPLHVASLVFQRAYASVSQQAVFAALKRAGVTRRFIDYLSHTLSLLFVRFEAGGGRSECFPMRRGIPLGDPLTSVLLTMVLEDVGRCVPARLGVTLGGTRIQALAAGESLLLLATGPTRLAKALAAAEAAAGAAGLLLSVDDCRYAWAQSPSQRPPPPLLAPMAGCALPVAGPADRWTYLKRQMQGLQMVPSMERVREVLTAACADVSDAENEETRIRMLEQTMLQKLTVDLFLDLPSKDELCRMDGDVVGAIAAMLSLPPNETARMEIAMRSGEVRLWYLHARVPRMVAATLGRLEQSRTLAGRALIKSAWVHLASRFAGRPPPVAAPARRRRRGLRPPAAIRPPTPYASPLPGLSTPPLRPNQVTPMLVNNPYAPSTSYTTITNMYPQAYPVPMNPYGGPMYSYWSGGANWNFTEQQ